MSKMARTDEESISVGKAKAAHAKIPTRPREIVYLLTVETTTLSPRYTENLRLT